VANVNYLGSYGDGINSSLMFRNKLINGGFDIWQRGTSQTSDGYGSDDRWLNSHSGSTKTASRQTFTLGQTDVPASPKYWSRTVVTSAAGSANYCHKRQAVESVLSFAGQTVTLSFWAKADASKNIAIEFKQSFGTGGSPSADVNGASVTTVALTSTWARYTVTANIPSISGKILGTDGNDNLQIVFWFDAGSSFNSRTNSLGQQSGTFDIANVQLESGTVATPFEQRPIGLELNLCQRFYQVHSAGSNSIFNSTFQSSTSVETQWIGFIVPMRDFNTVTLEQTITSGISAQSFNGTIIGTATSLQLGATSKGESAFRLYLIGTGYGTEAKFVFIGTNKVRLTNEL